MRAASLLSALASAVASQDNVTPSWLRAFIQGQHIASDAMLAEYEAALPPWYGSGYLPTGPPEALAPFTLEVQEELWRHQNPSICADKQFTIVEPWDSGMGSEFHVGGAVIAAALEHDRIAVFSPRFGASLSHGEYCKDTRSYECFLLPLSNCTLPKTPRKGQVLSIKGTASSRGRTDVPEKWRRRWKETGQHGDVLQWWRAQMATYFLRWNERTAALMRSARVFLAANHVAPLPLPRDTFSIHVRHGDKGKEVELHPWEDYIAVAQAMAMDRGITERNIFLSTEDPKVVNQALAEPGWNIMVIPWDRENEHHDVVVKDGSDLVLFSFLNLLLAVEADHFVGMRTSNWNRLIDELRKTWPVDASVANRCCSKYGDVTCGAGWKTCDLDLLPRQWR